MKKILRPLSFSLMGVIIMLLIAGSMIEQFKGTEVAVKYVYTAPWTICLWAITVGISLCYMFTIRMWQQLFTCLLHFSFVVILAGAITTHLFGKQGEVHLRIGDAPKAAYTTQTDTLQLPFAIALNAFRLEYYPGTQAPMDYVSELQITDNDKTTNGQVSMNHILSYRNYRFYQSRYDTDGQGTTLQMSYDPWGIGITYSGYALLLIAIIGFFLQKRTHFKELLNNKLLKTTIIAAALCMPLFAKAEPKTVSRETASKFGELYVYYNNRVCPMKTLADDFTTKLYGKPTYQGLSSEQVVCGWIFYYDKWANEEIIKVKGKSTRQLLGGKYVSLNDFVSKGKYKLQDKLQEGDKNAKAADEKFRLISMLCTGSLIKIYPITTPSASLKWYSFSDQMPADIAHEDWQFVVGSMDYAALQIAQNNFAEAREAFSKIKQFQEAKAGADNLPSALRFKSELLYNRMSHTRPMAMACATIGILLFITFCWLLSTGKKINDRIFYTCFVLILFIALLLAFVFALRWIISGHIPLSNGFETMQFIALVATLLTTIFAHKQPVVLPFGFLVCGMTMMVSMMSASNPQITLLMPVLQSPLLTLHVSIIMIAYCLLFFIMLNGVMGLVLNGRKEQSERLMVISQLLLYPAVFCLAAGIFIGAVWANISWGRYWGWDPKEVWALITLMVYAFAFHTRSLKWLNKPLTFHIFSIVAFLFVLFTYFGVNFVLGGMHSYA